ncbi:MAG: redox-sensing transcriptional repressor Rex [Bacillota bacterium]|jgi:redox-sensing transcriptional repressor|nr:redox-sensing transcriptional repressor Rex [Bacillota bacterium]NLJ02886.1 redox-sensing transcriptional repressor Rex [Bacillota bacterium]
MTLRGRRKGEAVPQGVVVRLPIYFRYLTELESAGVERISSAQLGEALDFTAAQIRSDLSYFGSFGQQGYGYNVSELLHQVKQILGLQRVYSMVLVGAGNLGKAIGSYEGFRKRGFDIKAVFDIDPHLIGNHHAGCVIRSLDELPKYLEENQVDIGIIATPKEAGQSICDLFVQGGVPSIWNFSPTHLNTPDEVIVEDMHLTDSLLRLAFRMNERG